MVCAIESSLTRYIGPIAKILVKKEVAKYQTMERLYLALARYISDERDREGAKDPDTLARRFLA